MVASPIFSQFQRVIVALALLLAATLPGTAQVWPAKTVHILVPFGAGSTPDIVARLVADGLAKKYPGSTFVVENKPGASGNLATDMVAKALPDGATLGISIGGPLAINTLLFSKLPYDPQGYRSRDPVGHAAERARRQPGPQGQQRRRAGRAAQG
jgi:tripartite-type tricarboxylate transporter receptor subunit TctC